MFISKAEKDLIWHRLDSLELKIETMLAAQNESKQKINEGWTPEKRARHSVFMKKSWADRKAGIQA